MKSLDERIHEAEQDYLQEVKKLSQMLLGDSKNQFEIELQGRKMKQAQQMLRELRAEQTMLPALFSSVA